MIRMLLCNEEALVTSDLTTPELMVIWGDDILNKPGRVGCAHAVLIRYIETGAACEHGTENKRQLS